MPTEWAIVPGGLTTPWAADVSPESVHPEHPRPQLVRPEWLGLNGLWEYVVADAALGRPAFDPGRRILVPFALESALSGVGGALRPTESLWYRRTVRIPGEWEGRRILLHFGAVDDHADVFVDGMAVGSHDGGYLPFTIEITAVAPPSAEVELVVAVRDATDREHGKQSPYPGGLSYTSVSGIWQTVWLEAVPPRHIADLEIATSFPDSAISVRARTEDPAGLELEVVASEAGREVARGRAAAGGAVELRIPDARAWSPDDPHLYDLTVRLLDGGEAVDEVASYAGIRTFSIVRGADGARRFALNGRALYQHGVLDQGYWPDGLYTPPTDAALEHDVRLLKEFGYNAVRKHVKIESARWYHHCDRMGLLVWQDMPSGGGAPASLRRTFRWGLAIVGLLRLYIWGRLGTWWFRRIMWRAREDDAGGGRSEEGRRFFESQLHAMIDALGNAPSIAMWIPFNEGWGQYDAARIAREVAEHDPSRWVDHASGWCDRLVGDIVSFHDYSPRMTLPPRARIRDRVLSLSEYGGFTHRLPGHAWADGEAASYREYDTLDDLWAVYEDMLVQLRRLAGRGLSASILTQLCDVELEVDGLVTYDRRVAKLDPERSRELGRALIAAGSDPPFAG